MTGSGAQEFFIFIRGCMVVVTFQSVFRVNHIKKNFIFKKLFLKLAHQNNLKYNKKLIFNKKNLNFKKHGFHRIQTLFKILT